MNNRQFQIRNIYTDHSRDFLATSTTLLLSLKARLTWMAVVGRNLATSSRTFGTFFLAFICN